jgi:hypothetical protein
MIFVGLLLIGIFLTAIDIHQMAAPVSTNHLQDNLLGLFLDWT